MRPRARFLLAASVLLEVFLIVLFVDAWGFGAWLLEVAASALLGVLLLSTEAGRVWREAREAWREGRAPEAPLLQGLLVAVGGLLLILPGLATDAVGLLLMIPPLRRASARFLANRWGGGRTPPAGTAARADGGTVEPEYKVH